MKILRKFLSFCLKWFFLIFVPLFSLALIGAGSYVLWDSWGDPNRFPITVIIVAIGFAVWHKEGGFIGWRLDEIRAFKRNWEKLY